MQSEVGTAHLDSRYFSADTPRLMEYEVQNGGLPGSSASTMLRSAAENALLVIVAIAIVMATTARCPYRLQNQA